MATTVLPGRSDGLQRFGYSTTLGGSAYGLEFTWNSREGAWWLAVSDAAGTLLLSRKLVLGTPLLARFSDPRLPAGELLLIDTSGSGVEAGLTDIGSRVLLTFTDAADLP